MVSLGVDIGGTSVKMAALRDGSTIWTARSDMYVRPDRAQLIAALRQAGSKVAGDSYNSAGICVPGLMDEARTRVTLSVNVPGLVDQPFVELLRDAFGPAIPQPAPLPDSGAAAYDIYHSQKMTGRLLVLVLGTGVGAAVVDEAGLLRVDGDSPGHLGQVDVSIEGHPVIGPDGGAGGLEGYIGATALRQRYGEKFAKILPTLDASAPPLLALARTIRISHAMYRPHHVILAGGIGIALQPVLPIVRELTQKSLTSIARPGWTLACGDGDYHAAIGAARYAASHPVPR
jgi:predicted NBD/HSP70 family sugar kinase